jgi:hypothetical protein
MTDFGIPFVQILIIIYFGIIQWIGFIDYVFLVMDMYGIEFSISY